jgi:N utilization substance protein A
MYEGREGDLVTGIVQQVDYRSVILDLGDAEAILPGSERIPFERLDRGNRVKALILEVRNEPKGSQIVVSRSHPDLVRRLLELEVPELSDGTVEIVNIAREPGHRTKIAVISHDPNVDPKGACVGAPGSRVRQVVNELRGEKVDVVQWRDDVAQFIAEALGPAKVKEVQIDEEEKTANVIVSEHQLSLAIGKEGQNARLAARLSGYKVDIRSDNEGVEPEAPEAPPADGGDTAEADTVDSTADSDAAMASSAADSETDTVDSTADTDTAMAASAADAETDEADDAETDEADDGAEMIVAEIPTGGAADDENSDDEDSIEDSGPDTESE